MIRDDLEPAQTLWRYRRALPLEKDDSIVSLGEGMTPILEEMLDGSSVGLKLEYLAPTGSFKDRGASVLLSRLKEMGVSVNHVFDPCFCLDAYQAEGPVAVIGGGISGGHISLFSNYDLSNTFSGFSISKLSDSIILRTV